jgi:TonB family protein
MSMRLLSVLLVLSAVSSGSGQTILGRARDRASGAVLRNIEIQLVSDTGTITTVLARTTTDSSGAFMIDAPALGTYRLVFNAPNGTMLSGALPVTSDVVQREFSIQFPEERQYLSFQVERPVRAVPGNPHPRYPDALRAAGIQGEVLAQFIVDTMGKADMRTFKALRSTQPDFTFEVRNAVANMDFYPATLGGKKVRQVVQMPFDFCLNGALQLPTHDTGRYAGIPPVGPTVCGGR